MIDDYPAWRRSEVRRALDYVKEFGDGGQGPTELIAYLAEGAAHFYHCPACRARQACERGSAYAISIGVLLLPPATARALILARRALHETTARVRSGYDWNSDPDGITLLQGLAFEDIERELLLQGGGDGQ